MLSVVLTAGHTLRVRPVPQRDGGLGPPPVRAVDLSLPEPVLRQVTASLEEIVLLESVNGIEVVPSPGPGHPLYQQVVILR